MIVLVGMVMMIVLLSDRLNGGRVLSARWSLGRDLNGNALQVVLCILLGIDCARWREWEQDLMGLPKMLAKTVSVQECLVAAVCGARILYLRQNRDCLSGPRLNVW